MNTMDRGAPATTAVVSPAQGTEAPAEQPQEDRRSALVTDRRTSRRGGRRATDMLAEIAKFAYRLLTEPPR